MLLQIIWVIALIALAFFLGRLSWGYLKDHRYLAAIIQGVVAFMVLMFAFGPILDYEDAHEAPSHVTSTSKKSSSSSSKSNSKSENDKESREVVKARVKNTCDALNEEMSKHSELEGFSMKPSGDQFKVTVPSSTTSLSNNDQKSIYKSVVDLIYSYDNGTNQGSYVEFDGDDGMPVAHYSYVSDSVKLDK